jgi:hypothetical protein
VARRDVMVVPYDVLIVVCVDDDVLGVLQLGLKLLLPPSQVDGKMVFVQTPVG